MPLFWVALIGNFVLFFVAQNAAMKGNQRHGSANPGAYSLITGFTLSASWRWRSGTAASVRSARAALPPAITFVIASIVAAYHERIQLCLSGVVAGHRWSADCDVTVALHPGVLAQTVFEL